MKNQKLFTWLSLPFTLTAAFSTALLPSIAAPAPTPTLENRPIRQKWAVVVGAAKFKEKRLTEESLATDAVAKEFYDYLVDQNGGRFPANHVKLIINSAATKNNVMSALTDQFLGPEVGPDDLVVVFIATNSFPTTDGGTYLCAYDCALDNVYSTCFSMQELMDRLKHNIKSDRVVLVLESRYSGAAQLTSGGKGLLPIYNVDLNKVMLGSGSIILASSGANEMTVNGVFSKSLVQALREENGLIGLNEAFTIAKAKTRDDADKSAPPRQQTPVMKSQWKGNELVLGAPTIGSASELPEGIKTYMAAEQLDANGNAALGNGDVQGAIDLYKSAIKANPAYAQAMADCASALCSSGDLAQSAQMYKSAIATKPDESQFHSDYAHVLSKSGKELESHNEFVTAVKLDPKNVSALSALGALAMRNADYASARQYYKAAANLLPANSKLQQRLSFSTAMDGDPSAAILYARDACTMEPDSVSAKLNLGSVFTICNNSKAALSAFKDACQLDPNDADARFILSKSYEANGNNSSAAQELAAFIKLAPTSDPRLADARARLAKLTGK